LADTEVCMPTGVHGNVSQFWLSVPTHHKYCTIPDSISVFIAGTLGLRS
jgi:hypothetical protein